MGRLRARGLGPRLLGGRGCSSGGWSSAPRTGCPMAAAPRKTWSRGRDLERPGLAARRSVLLRLFVPRFLARCLPLGVPRRGPRDSEAQALGSFREAGALRLGKGNFHQAWSSAPRSSEPSAPGSGYVSSAFSGQQLPSGLRCPLGEVEGGGLNETQLRAKRLRLSRSWPPHPDSTHLSGGSGWGAPRPCRSGGGFFHYVEDAPAGRVGPRRASASYRPGRILYTALR